MAYPATPKTWVAGDVLTAAQLNAELRDALLAAFPISVNAWTAYTPTLTQSATVTKTVNYARYMKIGRTVIVNMLLTVTGSGTAVNSVIIGLPVAADTAANDAAIGTGVILDTSAVLNYGGLALLASATTCWLIPSSTDSGNILGAGVFSAALAVGDKVRIHVVYESAA